MFKLLLFLPAAALFMAINFILACYIAIWLGYGPPNWQTALNLVVRLTTFQNYLNAGRAWIEKKAPWAEKILVRLHVPKPIIIVDTTYAEEGEEDDDEDMIEGISAVVPGELAGESDEPPPEVSDVPPSDEPLPNDAEELPVPTNEEEQPVSDET